MARGDIKIKRKPKQQTRAMEKLQSLKPRLEKSKTKKQDEIVHADQDNNFVIPDNLMVTDQDLDLFTKLQQDLQKTKKDLTVSQKLKTQALDTVKADPAKDPEVRAVYAK